MEILKYGSDAEPGENEEKEAEEASNEPHHKSSRGGARFWALQASSAVIHFKHPHILFNSGILVCYSLQASLPIINLWHIKSYSLKMFLSDLPVCLSDIVRSSLFKQSLAIIHQMQYPKIRNFRHIYGFFNSPPP